jgi:exodeoxyribonuclease-3
MKIVNWNCHGALRNKTKQLDKLNADICIIQEREDPEFSTQKYREWAGNYLWVGDNKNRGIGIFPKKNIDIKKLDWSGSFKIQGLNSKSSLISWKTSDLKLFLPFSINNMFTILAVWTKGKQGKRFDYIGQVWKYLQIHQKNTFIIGDFNSSQKWDKEKRIDAWWNHASVVEELNNLGFESLYHVKTKELQGLETKATYFHHKKKESPHYIDYMFCAKNMLSILELDIKEYDDWIKLSDHLPLVMSIEEK